MLFCLKEFQTVSPFLQYSKKLEESSWNIDKQLHKDRVYFHDQHPLFIELKQRYLEKKLSIFMLKEEEVITWLDTMLLLRRSMLVLFERGVLQEDMKIIMEYPFVLGNQMHSDYLIIFKQAIKVYSFVFYNFICR